MQQTVISSGLIAWDNKYYKMDETGYRPTLGLIWAPEDEKYALGFTASQTLIFDASQYSQSSKNYDVLSDGTVVVAANGVIAQPISRTGVLPQYPLTLKFGAAWFPSQALLVAGDVTYYSAVGADSAVFTWDRRAVMNFALGGEYFFSPTFAVRAGCNTDFSNANDLTSANEKVDLYGLSLSGSWFTKTTSISVGINDSFGKGTASIVSGGSAQRLSVQAVSVFIGTSYNY